MQERPAHKKNIPTLVKDPSLVEKRRRQIVDAAVRLFVDKGFHKTTTREIARVSGLSIGSLYEYIQSKEDVLYLVCETIHAAIRQRLENNLQPEGNGRTRLEQAIKEYFQVCDEMADMSARLKSAADQVSEGEKLNAMLRTSEQTGEPADPTLFPHPIASNCIPHIDAFVDLDYTKEEWKMVHETRKIMGDDTIQLSPTCVRVPVFNSHAESVNVEFHSPLSAANAKAILAEAPGVTLIDDPANTAYPLQLDASGKDDTFVGRVREDRSVPYGLNMWVVSDNLRKGAALNTIQIAEKMLEMGLLKSKA